MKTRFHAHTLNVLSGMLILIALFFGCADQNNTVGLLPEDLMAEDLGVLEDSGFAADAVTSTTVLRGDEPNHRAPSLYPRVKLDVPFIPQVPPGEWANTHNCGQASVVNVVNYHMRGQCLSSFSITYENKWLAKMYVDRRYNNPNGWSTTISQLVDLAKYCWGYRNSVAGNGTLDKIYAELKCNRPVVVAVRVDMSTNTKARGHFMVLVGMDSSTVWLNDVGKSRGKDRKFRLSQFQKSWATQGRAYAAIRP